jgi:nucleotide-binding universal stress UspA family protein
MIRTLLVPLDGSALAETALPIATELAHLLGASIVALRVIDPLGEARPIAALLADDEDTLPEINFDVLAEREQAQHYLDGVVAQLRAAGLRAHARVAVGYAADQIVQAATQFDLVTMATHGRSGIRRWAFGSVADSVLRRATTPLLLVRADQTEVVATGRPRRILVPLDGSALAEQALPVAMELARAAKATIVLMRSFCWPDEIATSFAYLDPIRSGGLIEQDEARVRAELEAVAARLTAQGATITTIVGSAPPAEAILATVAMQHADLIVMSTHGRGGLKRWALGSVADRVLHLAAVPVLVVRAEAAGATAEVGPVLATASA